MDRRTRICVWVIMIGLVNFLAYVIGYAYLYGEAINGRVELHDDQVRYFLAPAAYSVEVSRGAFIYSAIHSISIWLTVGAVMLAMLTLAKDRLVSSMRRTIIRGRTFYTILATIITLVVVVMTIIFTLRFAGNMSNPRPPAATQQAVLRQ